MDIRQWTPIRFEPAGALWENRRQHP